MKYIPLLTLAAALPAVAGSPSLSPHSRLLMQTQQSRATTVVPAYLTVDPSALDRGALDALGVHTALEVDSLITARVPLDALPALVGVDGVKYVQTATAVEQTTDVARVETGAASVNSGVALPRPFTGKGVVVGIVDSGFDYGHAAFTASDGTSRIVRVWEQSTASGTAPAAYGYGTEFTSSAEILAAGGDIRNNSHGTHVAAIAAGSDNWPGGSHMGNAPDAEIVLVSMLQSGNANVCISDAIAYIFDYADSVDKPCVVNLSLGGHSGPHDGTSSFDRIADALQGPGRLIVGASGNQRAMSSHLRARFDGASDTPMLTCIDFCGKVSTGEIEIWGPAGAFEVSLLAVKVSNGEVAERVKVYGADAAADMSVSLGRNISGTIDAASEVSPLNGKGHLLLSSRLTSIRTGYAVAIEVSPLAAGNVDIWADSNEARLSDSGIAGYSAPDGEATVCEIGGTAKSILTVGAYTTRDSYRILGESADRSLGETVGDLCSFSSCGPTADGRMKPQVTAPGAFISSAVSNNDASGTLLLSAFHNDGARDHLYGYMQGTSMASPHMAGIVATWLEAYPALTPALLASTVQKTARTDAYTGLLPDGSNHWGWGKVDAVAGLRECLRLAGDDGVADVAVDSRNARLTAEGVLFLRDMSDVLVEIFSPSGQLLYSRRLPRVCAGETLAVDGGGHHRFLRVASGNRE